MKTPSAPATALHGICHPDSKSQAPIRVALVEDQPNLRVDLAHLLASEPGFAVVAVIDNGQRAMEQLPETGAEVVLMDIGLPDIDGVQCVRRLKPQMPRTEFMMLTVFEDHDKVVASFTAGATGYLIKSAPWDRLREAIHDLHRGGSPMSSSIARRLLACLIQAPPQEPSLLEAGLTLREEEVLKSLARGSRYKEIAHELAISPHTVRAHIHSVYEKLHVRSKTEAVNLFRKSTRLP